MIRVSVYYTDCRRLASFVLHGFFNCSYDITSFKLYIFIIIYYTFQLHERYYQIYFQQKKSILSLFPLYNKRVTVLVDDVSIYVLYVPLIPTLSLFMWTNLYINFHSFHLFFLKILVHFSLLLVLIVQSIFDVTEYKSISPLSNSSVIPESTIFSE